MDIERGEEGEMYGKSNTETYITTCKIESRWEFAVWLRKLGSLYQPRGVGWGAEMGGRFKTKGIYVYLWLIHVKVDRKQRLNSTLFFTSKKKKKRLTEKKIM